MEVNPPAPRLRRLAAEDEVSFVPMDALSGHGRIDLDQTRTLADVSSGYTEFQDNDVIVAKITPCFENGKAALATGLTNGAAYGTTELHVLRAGPALDPGFLFYVATSDRFRKLGESEMYGAGGQKRVPPEFVKDFPMPVPPLPEQRHIAAFLDRKTAQIDGLIARKQELLEKLKEERLTVITQAVTRGLNPAARLRNSGIPWLGQVPQHWQVMKFRYRTKIQEGQVDPEEAPYSDLPLIAPNHIESNTGHVFDVTSAHDQAAISGKYLVRKGDVVYSKIRPHLNKCALVNFDGLCSADMYPIRTEPELTSGYLLYWMLARPFLDYATESSMRVAMPKLNRDTLSAAPLVVPPESEQNAIVAHIRKLAKRIDAMATQVELAIDRLYEYRNALITSATTGEVDARNTVFGPVA
jgi:type I restriction enzyme S subunit